MTTTPQTDSPSPAQLGVKPALRGSLRKRLKRAGGLDIPLDMLSLIALVMAASPMPALWPQVVLAVALVSQILLALSRLRFRRSSIAPTGGPRVTTRVLAVPTIMLSIDVGSSSWPWILAALVAILIMGEGPLARAVRNAHPFGAHVPGIQTRNRALFSASLVYFANTTTLLLLWLFLALGSPTLTVVPLVLAGGLAILSGGDAVLRLRQRRHADARLQEVIADYAPEFMVHWDAPSGTAYQIGMWLPFLERVSERFIVVIRNKSTFEAVTELTDRPVLLRFAHTDLDVVTPPSLRAVFYVNNQVKNMHMVRYPQLKHVQLNHGDSDKTPSFSPVMRAYDKDFVAGQAAIDRFPQNGVSVHEGLFTIVGRPQVESIEVKPGTIHSNAPTVLYAPTWAGFTDDAAYSSLLLGNRLVTTLLSQGCTVIFRPHPYTSRTPELAKVAEDIKALLAEDSQKTGRAHLFGEVAQSTMSVVDCFNHADAMIADISSVVPDFLYSEKPYAICAMIGSPEEFEHDNPIAQGGYTITGDGSNIESAVGQLLGDDTKLTKRSELKRYYLGDFDTGSYSEIFVRAAREILAQ